MVQTQFRVQKIIQGQLSNSIRKIENRFFFLYQRIRLLFKRKTDIKRVLVFGEGPAEVAYELAAMTILSVLVLMVGVFLYQRLQMRRV